jgi:hypothetical protein
VVVTDGSALYPAVLVRLQTDHAAWLGEKQLLAWTK